MQNPNPNSSLIAWQKLNDRDIFQMYVISQSHTQGNHTSLLLQMITNEDLCKSSPYFTWMIRVRTYHGRIQTKIIKCWALQLAKVKQQNCYSQRSILSLEQFFWFVKIKPIYLSRSLTHLKPLTHHKKGWNHDFLNHHAIIWVKQIGR